MFSRGDRVEVTSDNYPEPESTSYVGSTGTVSGTTGTFVAVRLDGRTSSTGFEPDEITHTR